MIGGGLKQSLTLLQHSQHGSRFHVLRKSIAKLGQSVGCHVDRAHLVENVAEVGSRRATGRLGIVGLDVRIVDALSTGVEPI